MKRVAFTFIGKDRPGIIARVTEVLYQSGCNIEDTTMTLLESQFAMILIATLPNASVEKKLVRAFDSIRKTWGLAHFRRPLSTGVVRGEKHPPGTQTFLLSVVGKDRTGIVYETSRVLAKFGLNITDLNSKILGHGHRSVFVMMLEVDVPKGFSLKRLETAWKRLKTRLGVDVSFKAVERLSL